MDKKVFEFRDAQERNLTDIRLFKDETKQMADSLTHGIAKILTRYLDESGDHFWRQVGVRIVFSLVDTLCYRMKKLIVLNGDFSKFKLGEIVCLKERSFRVNPKGDVEIKNAYPNTIGNVKFVFQMMARLINSDFEIDQKSKEWKSFQMAVDIRNRITHPKRPSDLEVSLQDYKIVGDTYNWFVKCYNQLIEGSKDYFQTRRIS